MNRILLVEDDSTIISTLVDFLNKEGFMADSATGQQSALECLQKNNYDLILLDISLSDGNGFSLCSAIKSDYKTPVIFLTASSDEFSVVTGLDLGADDYISKPFRPRELISRINSVLRRNSVSRSALEFGNIVVDTDKAVVTKNGSDLFLSALEYRLLLVFINNKGIVISRNKLMDEIWDASGEFVNDNTLTVYIKRLREKIEDDQQNPVFIKTIRGLGYKFGD